MARSMTIFQLGKMIPKYLGKLGVPISEALLRELKKRCESCFRKQSITLLVSNANTAIQKQDITI
jgi:hypothetical protein